MVRVSAVVQTQHASSNCLMCNVCAGGVQEDEDFFNDFAIDDDDDDPLPEQPHKGDVGSFEPTRRLEEGKVRTCFLMSHPHPPPASTVAHDEFGKTSSA